VDDGPDKSSMGPGERGHGQGAAVLGVILLGQDAAGQRPRDDPIKKLRRPAQLPAVGRRGDVPLGQPERTDDPRVSGYALEVVAAAKVVVPEVAGDAA